MPGMVVNTAATALASCSSRGGSGKSSVGDFRHSQMCKMEISVENWLHVARLGWWLSRESAGYSYLRTQLQILRIHMKCQEQQAANVCRLSRQGQDRLISGAHGLSSLADQVSSRFRDRPCLWHMLTRMHAHTHKGTPSPGVRLYHTLLYYHEIGFHPEHEWPASPSVSAPAPQCQCHKCVLPQWDFF